METKANHFLIGGFVLLIIAAGFSFVYWVRADATAAGQGFSIRFSSSVAGLAPSSTVLFNGLRVGRVDTMRIVPEDTRLTEVTIVVREDTPVRVNSRASIVQTGLTGAPAILITPGSPDSALVAGAGKRPFPLIKADPGLSSNLLEAAPEVLANINATFMRINDLLANNEDGVRQIIKNIGAFTQTLDDNKGKIDSILNDAQDLASRLRHASEKLEATVDKLHDAVANDKSGVIEEVRQAAGSFRMLADKLDKAVGDQADGITRQAKRSLVEIELFMKDSRTAAQSLDRVLGRIERDPQSLIFGGASTQKYTPK